MLAPGNYIQWKSRIKRYIDTKPNRELFYFCLTNPPYELAEAIQIILTGIDNDIYSTVDACPNACEMWKANERLKQGESINVQDLETNLFWEFGKFTSLDGESLESYYSRFYKLMNELTRNQCKVTNHQVNVKFLLQLQPEWQRFVTLVKQNQELKHVSYYKLHDILKQHQHEVNEIRAEKIARVANPLALVAQQQQVYHPQTHPTHFNQNSSIRTHQSATRKREKADKEIDKLMDLISLSFKKIYKPTNNNLRTSSNTSRANQDNSLRIHKNAGYEGQRSGTVAEARDAVGSSMKPKRAKDAAYHREKMLLCKQEEAGIQLNAEQADWKDDTDDESDDQELEAHYMYMAKLQQVSPDAVDSGPIFDKEPKQKVQNDDHYDLFAIECQHTEQSESAHNTYLLEQDVQNVSIESVDMIYDSEQIDQNDEDVDLAKKRQSVQTRNMLNKKCRTSFAEPEYLKKAKQANPRLYDIGCYNDNLALMLSPESDEVIRLEKESRTS
uniref:Gag-Pol polyprotein n=1 Tax=Tanacetum cinerariifolium TaxID=118510 RepID=A0A699JSZ3_TANCI|nr:hypothetical protein [Tanacetum cinerariifolium]